VRITFAPNFALQSKTNLDVYVNIKVIVNKEVIIFHRYLFQNLL